MFFEFVDQKRGVRIHHLAPLGFQRLRRYPATISILLRILLIGVIGGLICG